MGKSKRGGGIFDSISGFFGYTRDAVVSVAPAVVEPVATDNGTAKLADRIGQPLAPEGAGKTMTGGRRTRKHRKHAKKTQRRR